jgi:monoamine oxidase
VGIERANPEVVIVGAGAAGLAAAQALTEREVPSLILEARDRPRGRVDTRHDASWPVPIERGAEFLHHESPLSTDLAGRADVDLETVPAEHVRLTGGRARPTPDLEAALRHLLAREGRRHQDRSLTDVFARLPPPKRRAVEPVRFFVEGYHAAELDQISARSLAGGARDATQRRPVEGYDRLLAPLVEVCQTRLHVGVTVTEIRWRRGRVQVSCRSTTTGQPRPTVEAAAAIVTLPLGVLHAGAVAFVPRPPKWDRALTRLEVGPVEKVVLHFSEPVWLEAPAFRARRRRAAFWHAPGLPFPTWWTTSPREEPVLTGWAGGPAASGLTGLGPEERADRALTSLAQMLGLPYRILVQALVALQHHDWTSDPFSRGAYSYVGVGGLPAQRALCEVVDETLVLAGEALDPEDIGTVEGALASGRRAALKLARLRRAHRSRPRRARAARGGPLAAKERSAP